MAAGETYTGTWEDGRIGLSTKSSGTLHMADGTVHHYGESVEGDEPDEPDLEPDDAGSGAVESA